MPGSEWLHVRSFFFGHEDHDFVICFDARIVGLIAEYVAAHLQRLEDAGNPVSKFTSNVWPWRNSLKAFFCSEEGFQVQNALSVFTVKLMILPTPFCEFWHVTVPNCHTHTYEAHMKPTYQERSHNVFATLQDISTSFCILLHGQTMHSSGLDNVLASYNTRYYVTDQENNWNSYPQNSYSSPKICGIHEINDLWFLD